jgi:ABC-type bacteriocin/lantibiotic exporter with double-glycine peptidase domain
LALILWYGAMLVHEKKISNGILASFFMYALQVAIDFAQLSSTFGQFMQVAYIQYIHLRRFTNLGYFINELFK